MESLFLHFFFSLRSFRVIVAVVDVIKYRDQNYQFLWFRTTEYLTILANDIMIFRTNERCIGRQKNKKKKKRGKKLLRISAKPILLRQIDSVIEKKDKKRRISEDWEVLYVPIAENLKTMAIPSLLELSMGGRKVGGHEAVKNIRYPAFPRSRT